MRTLIGRSEFAAMFLAVAFAATSAAGQQDVHATIVPQASRMAAPTFRLPDVSGKNTQVADYHGKVVLLNFWATECGECKLEILSL
jgi:cytochrome oxidase Cu insertion factor (SCO1/SenC/PrrC family)